MSEKTVETINAKTTIETKTTIPGQNEATYNNVENKSREFTNILKVKADEEGIHPDERKRRLKNLAGAIAHGLRQFGIVYVRCFSPASAFKASKAIAVARGFIANQGPDLYNVCSFIEAEIGGKRLTGICYECFTNKTNYDELSKKEQGKNK